MTGAMVTPRRPRIGCNDQTTNKANDMRLQTSRRADPRPNAGKHERLDLACPVWDRDEIVASFGAADLIRHDEPSPVTAPKPKAAKAIHHRILIVDDDSLVRGSLAAVLESEGFVVDEAPNGIEAVTRAIERVPDLVLLDLNLPHWDGWTAFTKLERVRPLVPVIVITARPNQYNEAVRLGVDAFMEKPLHIPLLVRAIKRLTSEAENRHVRRITHPEFVTQLLVGPGS